MNGRGILQHNWDISPRDEAVPAWSDVGQTDWEAGKMAAYRGP